MRAIVRLGNGLVGLVTGVLAVAFLLYGGLMLWDMFRTEIRAFASYDLMQYRPNIEEDQPPYLDELIAINPDTAGWLTIYNTNIDYPVMQGKTDMEYINKDVYGEYTQSGSIFMASVNAKDFSDPYTLVYGHHMTNGSMFGDLFKFKDKAFFDANQTGIVIMENMAYDLTIMAYLETDAYDDEIYRPRDEVESLVEYLRTKATYFRDVPYEKILALSTCDDANTSGRTILLCAMNTRTAPLPDREYGSPAPRRAAIGHPMAGAYWSLVNLICLVSTAYFAVRMLLLRKRNLLSWTSLAICLVVAASIGLFVFTQDMHKPLQMVDAWTPVMIVLLALLLAVWYVQDAKAAKDAEAAMTATDAEAAMTAKDAMAAKA